MTPKQGSSQKNSSRKTSPINRGGIEVGEISGISGEVNIAAGDIIKTIQTYYERELTPGEVIEKDLKFETDELARGLREYLERLQRQVLSPEVPEPYKGLNPYTISEAAVFFGREQAQNDLSKAIKRGKLTILQAESGAGKTSLLQAGLIPHLILEKNLAVLVRPQFENPTSAIKKCFLGNLELTPKLAIAPLVDFLRRVVQIIGDSSNMYLVLDQFEEFFSKHTLEEDRQSFIRELAQCIDDVTLNVHWIFSITSEAFGQLGRLEPRIRNPFLNVQSLYLFNRDEAEEVIARPAQIYTLTFQEGLLDCLLDDLGQHKDAFIAPTQIQLVCLALYEELTDQDKVFTLKQYEAKGRATGILSGYVGNVLRHDLPPTERIPAYKILEELVTSEKKRIARLKTDLKSSLATMGISQDLAESTLDHLVNRRLLRQLGDQAGDVQYEIVHDYLLNEIELDEELVKSKQAQELLADGMKAWKRNQNLFLTREHLSFIEEEYKKHRISIQEDALQFLLVSAAINDKAPNTWLEMLPESVTHKLIIQYSKNFNSTDKTTKANATKILWGMRSFAPKSIVLHLYLWRILKWMFWIIPIAALVFFWMNDGYYWLTTPERSDWKSLQFNTAEYTPKDLVLALDPEDPDQIYVANSTSGWISRSKDGGKNWFTSTVSGGSDISDLATAQGTVYAITPNTIYHSTNKGVEWNVVNTTAFSDFGDYQSIAVNPQITDQIFLGTSAGRILESLDGGKSSTLLPRHYRGSSVKSLVTNGKVLVAATDDGLWVYDINETTWREISLVGCNLRGESSAQIISVAMPLAADAEQIGIWVALSELGICDSDYENRFTTTLVSDIPYENVYSLGIDGDPIQNRNVYLVVDQGLVRQRTWHWTNYKWWLIKLGIEGL